MKQLKDKIKVLRFRNFPVQWRGYAFFVEQGHNDQLNLSIINHLDEIRKLMRKESIDFIYFPYLIHEIRDAAVYNFPQMTKGDFSQTASSDILLQLLEDKEDAKNLPPCIMQYDRSEEGIVFKCLSDYREELQAIYLDICTKQENPIHLSAEKIRQSIDALTNPLSNSINEKCARVRAAFESLAKYYYIDGRRGEAKKILLDRNLLEWKTERDGNK